MEPSIEYATTNDGVNIACWSLGDGPAIVQLPTMPWSHAQLEAREPINRQWFDRLAQNHRVIRYDSRGSGLSDRDRVDFSLEAMISDLDAVMEKYDLDQAALFAGLQAGPAGIAYAAAHPERVSQLMLWCTFAEPNDWRMPQLQALQRLAGADFSLYTQALAHAMATGWDEGDSGSRVAAVMLASTDYEAWLAACEAFKTIDVSRLLPTLRVPTMVMHRRDVAIPSARGAQTMAANIPGARLVLLEGHSLVPGVGDYGEVAGIVDRFTLSAAPASRPAAESHMDRGSGLRIILCSDIQGHTAMMQSLGDDRGREVLREHERITRRMLAAYSGSEVKTMGDGFLASFGSAQRALQCAIALQQAFAESPLFGTANEALRVRIGLNAGEPIEEDDDIYGTSVIAAARIAALAQGGEILVSNVVRELAAGKGFLLADRGHSTVHGIEEPVRLYELHWAA